jgi:hypothetical protein
MTQILLNETNNQIRNLHVLALLATMSFQSCNDDKDIVMINDELPLKIDHLYMVGDATPAGWSIDNPTELTKTNDKFVFTYHGKLTTGFLKFPLSKGDWGATFIYALPRAPRSTPRGGQQCHRYRKGGDDNKWKVTEPASTPHPQSARPQDTAVYEGTDPHSHRLGDPWLHR